MKEAARVALAKRYPEDFQRIYESLKSGTPIDEVTVAEWAEPWLRLRERSIRPGTLCADKAAVHKWILPNIGDKALAGLQRADVRSVHEAAEAAGLVESSVERIHAVMMRMLKDALEEGHEVPQRTLAMKHAGGPGRSQRRALSVEDAKRILAVAMTRQDASRWVAAILQGMRPAEARGLRWSSLDLDRGVMRVEWQLKPLPYRQRRTPKSGFRVPRGFESIHLCEAFHLVRPKTRSGIRVVPLIPWLRTELTAWNAIAPESPYGLVWTLDGRPINDKADRDAWNGIVEEADVWTTLDDGSKRRPLLYEARHTAATLLMESGADETTLTAILGHSKITSTQAYLHTDETRKLAALERVGEELGVQS
jgi:integrase